MVPLVFSPRPYENPGDSQVVVVSLIKGCGTCVCGAAKEFIARKCAFIRAWRTETLCNIRRYYCRIDCAPRRKICHNHSRQTLKVIATR